MGQRRLPAETRFSGRRTGPAPWRHHAHQDLYDHPERPVTPPALRSGGGCPGP